MSTNAVMIGNGALVAQGGRADIWRGSEAWATYEGSSDYIVSVIAGLAGYQRFEWNNSDGPKYSITVFTPDMADAPVWELLCNYKEKDLLEHQRAVALQSSDPDAQAIPAIIAFCKNLPPNQRLPLIGSPDEPVEISGDALTLFNLYINGVRKYAVEDYVIRFTLSVSNAASIVVAYAGVDRLYTPTTGGGSTTLAGLTLPAWMATALGTIPVNGGNAVDTDQYSWSWLKRAPTCRQTTFGKVVIQQEFWLQAWSKFIYTPA